MNNKFKKEMLYSILWIIIYFILVILANILSNKIIKIPNSINALVEIIFPIIILFFLKKKNLFSYYGINSLKKLNYKNLLFLIPMIIISFVNLSFGIHINYSWQQILLISIAMLGVGFSEEILFRGFLMKAIMNKSTKVAILLPSMIFGIIHITNLFSGANIIMTTLQIIYATFFALMCSMFFYKTNNIIPCMICHSITNITNVFLPNNLSVEFQCIGCIAFIIPSAFYAWYLYKTKKCLAKVV